MANKTFTLILVPDDTARGVRRFRFQRKYLVQLTGAAAVLAVLLFAAVIHYFAVVRAAAENEDLRAENLLLRGQLKSIRERIDHIGSTLDRVEHFHQKLRAITLLSDPQRNLAMGPTQSEPGTNVPSSGDNPFVRLTKSEDPTALSSRLDKLSAEAIRQEQSLQELQAYFQEQRLVLATTPSTWPVRGWVTSDFAYRVDPYTAERVMHAGIDIAGPHGKEVYAPSDGTVVFTGVEGGYGNVLVLDHGFGIKTRYGHLSAIKVKPGDRVTRGQLIANIGNTGRSTGPHLHYEVRRDGIPQNPRKYILDE